jgi:hypothetical protein
MLVIVDFTASFPMLYKIWYSTEENEPLTPFLIYFVTYVIGVLTQPIFTIASSMFLFYLILLTILVIVSIMIKKTKLKTVSNQAML